MWCITAYLPVILDTVNITQLNRRFSHVLLDGTSKSTKFDSFKLNTTLSNLRLRQSKI